LYKCNILALVGGGTEPRYSNNKVMIWDDIQVQCIAELEFSSPVRGVRLRRDKIIIILENKVYIYNFSDLKLVHECINTYSNPQGLCSINCTGNMVMACLGEKVGVVRIETTKDKGFEQPLFIPAHNNAISQLALNQEGTILATASDKGTLIRVFDTTTGAKIHEFRRGRNSACIQCISFSKDSTAICLSSDKGTIHIYHLAESQDETSNRHSSLSFIKGFVPYFGSTWSCRQFSVNESNSICAFGNDLEDGRKTVIVLGSSGQYYKYSFSIDPNDKEECHEEELKEFF